MAPKKNKGGNNAYFMFLMDLRKKVGAAKANEEAAALWPNLSQEDKNYYINLAGQAKESKMTSLQEDMDQIQSQEKEQERLFEYMKGDIKSMIAQLSFTKKQHEQDFYLIHFNLFCRTTANGAFPAEVCLLRFNLKNGVTTENIYHSFIKYDKFPLGYAATMKAHSEKSHQIPHNHTMGKYTRRVMLDIFEFLEEDATDDGLLPPIFVADKELDQTTEILYQMTNQCDSPRKLKIYSLDYLLWELVNKISNNTGFPTVSASTHELARDVYEYTWEIACDFHQTCDAVTHCCRSKVIRWAYTVCDHCCRPLNIPMVRGRHVPLDAKIDNTVKPLVEPQPMPERVLSTASSEADDSEWKRAPALRRPHSNY